MKRLALYAAAFATFAAGFVFGVGGPADAAQVCRTVTSTVISTVTVTSPAATTTPTTTTTTPPTPPTTGAVYVDPASGNDSNPGTLEAPWRTITKAAAAVQPGQTAYLRGGTYLEPAGTVDWTRSGTAAAPLTIAGYPGEQAVINMRLKLAGAYQAVKNVTVGHNTHFGNFDVGDVCVWVAGNNNSFQQSEVTGCSMSGVFTTGTNFTLDRLYIHDIGSAFHTEGSEPLDHGVYMGGSNGVLSNSLIVRATGYGVQFWSSCASCRIVENTIAYNGASSVGGHGVMFAGSATTNSVVANNLIAYNSRAGIHSYALPANGNNLATTNLVYGNGGPAYEGAGYTVANPVSGDPLLGPDFRTGDGSPAIDAAEAVYATAEALDGAARVVPDIGAYER